MSARAMPRCERGISSGFASCDARMVLLQFPMIKSVKFVMAVSFLLTMSSAHAVRYLDGASVSSVIERGENGFSACGIHVVVLDAVNDDARFIDSSLRVIP